MTPSANQRSASTTLRPYGEVEVVVAKTGGIPRWERGSEKLTPPGALLAFSSVPIYEYKCPNGHVFELFQKMSDEQPDVCEVCGEGPLQRVLYPVAVHFKGSGFYSTDYGKGGSASRPATARNPTATRGSEKADKGDKKDKKEKNVKKVAEN